MKCLLICDITENYTADIASAQFRRLISATYIQGKEEDMVGVSSTEVVATPYSLFHNLSVVVIKLYNIKKR
jgi:hypothetical protein